jgi:hypothetical protein
MPRKTEILEFQRQSRIIGAHELQVRSKLGLIANID